MPQNGKLSLQFLISGVVQSEHEVRAYPPKLFFVLLSASLIVIIWQNQHHHRHHHQQDLPLLSPVTAVYSSLLLILIEIYLSRFNVHLILISVNSPRRHEMQIIPSPSTSFSGKHFFNFNCSVIFPSESSVLGLSLNRRGNLDFENCFVLFNPPQHPNANRYSTLFYCIILRFSITC